MWASVGNAAGCNFAATTNWNSAIDWAQNLSFAGHDDWRIPNINVLWTICVKDREMVAPYIDHTYFSNTTSSYFWSSTAYPYGTTSEACVSFKYGKMDVYNKGNSDYVRAVRGGE